MALDGDGTTTKMQFLAEIEELQLNGTRRGSIVREVWGGKVRHAVSPTLILMAMITGLYVRLGSRAAAW